ncbi:MAG: DUF2231 domain-containing protein [Verrucomicrobiota bacterium]
MFTLPSPLHPAIVHFPIALILVGAAFALASVFAKQRCLPWVSALLLALGAIGAFVAVQTGESAQEMVGELAGVPDRLLDEHEDWAERTEVRYHR